MIGASTREAYSEEEGEELKLMERCERNGNKRCSGLLGRETCGVDDYQSYHRSSVE